jgi:hypothetical protein
MYIEYSFYKYFLLGIMPFGGIFGSLSSIIIVDYLGR